MPWRDFLWLGMTSVSSAAMDDWSAVVEGVNLPGLDSFDSFVDMHSCVAELWSASAA